MNPRWTAIPMTMQQHGGRTKQETPRPDEPKKPAPIVRIIETAVTEEARPAN